MYSPYFEVAKQDKRPKKYYGKVIIYWFVFYCIFFITSGLTSEIFQIPFYWEQIPDINNAANPINIFLFWMVFYSFFIIIFLFIFNKIHNRKIITLINTSNSIRYQKIMYSFSIWFILTGIRYMIGFF